MIEQAEVVKITGETAFVSVARKSACGQCNACGFNSKQNSIVFETKNNVNATVGQIVELEIINKRLPLAIILVYVIPLIVFAIGMWLGSYLGGELIQFLCGLILLLISFITLKIFNNKLAPIVTIKSIIK